MKWRKLTQKQYCMKLKKRKKKEKEMYNLNYKLSFLIFSAKNKKFPKFLNSFKFCTLSNWINLKTLGRPKYYFFYTYKLRISWYFGHFKMKWNSSSTSLKLHNVHILLLLSSFFYRPDSILRLWEDSLNLVIHVIFLCISLIDFDK
jgi:hypothetical protein